jgi:zinc finger HIT domain-containing protein 3
MLDRQSASSVDYTKPTRISMAAPITTITSSLESQHSTFTGKKHGREDNGGSTNVDNQSQQGSRFPNNPHKRWRQQSGERKHSNKSSKRQAKEISAPPTPVCSICSVTEDHDAAEHKEHATPTPTPKEPPKYKCPKCRALYCSVACCRKHKEICPGVASPEAAGVAAIHHSTLVAAPPGNASDDENDSIPSDVSDDESLEEGWKITEEMKHALQKSSWLRQELGNNSGLRQMITNVVKASRKSRQQPVQKHNRHNKKNIKISTASNPANDELLEKRQNHADFNEFCDKLLVLAGILEPQSPDDANSLSQTQDMEEWLQQSWDQLKPDLVLKPIVKKKLVLPTFEPIDLSSSSDDDDDDESEEE